MDQLQDVWLTGGISNVPGVPNGSAFDVFFTWDLSTAVASDFQLTACDAYGFTGAQSETATVVGNTIVLQGQCAPGLFWGGEVTEMAPDSLHSWVGSVWANDQPTSAAEPALAPLMLAAIGAVLVVRGMRYRRRG